MEKKQMLEWAIAGARSQLTALENELAAISKGLSTGTRVLVKGKPVKRRKKRKMSAAARKAASQWMKAYWVKRRSKQKRRAKA
ncbi:MAG: hypothetical protein ACR2L2_20510 [Acidobacteriota bacterium]